MKKLAKITILLLPLIGIGISISTLFRRPPSSAIGIIGGADGPTTIFVAKKTSTNPFIKYGLIIGVPVGIGLLLYRWIMRDV